ncbi:Pr6Pr family membrane protein [Serinibacter arcticus]|uniref:Integral membrane protein n=1 Tax=Serinibacter arcticus TaxID=1655435 RepID=A0A4Z1E0C5_9MICO|nr:Pr6Pr family membrane protein [Serinibacter arcticus]TGO05326.1 Integral membrane protein [Serinibacter arcticus]
MTAAAPARPAGATGPRRIASLVVRALVVVLVVAAEIELISAAGETFQAANHYSYFTILSNVFGALVMAAAIVRPIPDGLRGAAVTFLMLTGIVYNLMLRGVDVQTTAFANLALHVVVPILVVLDWLLAPPRTRLTIRHVLLWMIVPLAYLAYSLVRGPIVDWYPYPFLDPRPSGYGTVVVGALSVAVAFFAASLFVAWIGNRLGGHGSGVHRDRVTV